MQLIEFDSSIQAHLVAKAQAGDPHAFGRIYDETFPQVYHYAVGLTRSREDAEDLTAETYERALRSLNRYESREIPILIWLLRIARNVARERSSRYHREPVISVPTEQLAQMPDSNDNWDSQPVWDSILANLPESQRDVIALRLAGLRGREIAQALGKAEGTVKALQYAAIRNLRRTVTQ